MTVALIPVAECTILNEVGKFGIWVVVVATGLNTKPRELVRTGVRLIILGLACWTAVAVTSLVV